MFKSSGLSHCSIYVDALIYIVNHYSFLFIESQCYYHHITGTAAQIEPRSFIIMSRNTINYYIICRGD